MTRSAVPVARRPRRPIGKKRLSQGGNSCRYRKSRTILPPCFIKRWFRARRSTIVSYAKLTAWFT